MVLQMIIQFLSWIEGYKIPINTPVLQSEPPLNKNHSITEREHFKDAIDNLLSIGAISECQSVEGQFLSSYFLIPKLNGKHRFILNFKQLNKFINSVQCSCVPMETRRSDENKYLMIEITLLEE